MEVMDWFRQLHWNNLRVSKVSKNYKNHEDKTKSPPKRNWDVIIVERSALTAFEIFSKNLKDSGKMSEWEFSLLARFVQLVDWEPKYTLYLQLNYNNKKKIFKKWSSFCCYGVKFLNKELVEALHNRHEALFVKGTEKNEKQSPNKEPKVLQCISNTTSSPSKTRMFGQSQVIVINGNQDKEKVFEDTVKEIDQIRALLI
ncbi:hypothetical protein RFI_20535 [Reticulomyxa filosa]|uniref:Deoxynucleoside kinase domain-containing protein n=1 Tax=Reticulomyxa filosa TaxID=46433 RepID=X6MS43_RETFI|nr:hypothetical protein RFI_20535 [Reticulomyxa filosa]|eukprot:ETO16803.1 hypothetical protein RFI_20535 [Reticulomyxa filosa]